MKPLLHTVTRCLAALLTLLVFTSCSPEYIGYGVVLWSPDESVVTSGAMIPVVSESDMADTYTLEIDETNVEVARFRVRVFEEESQAIDAAAAYAPVAPLYGEALLNALPMRSEKTTETDNRVYRLGKGEIVKIVGRDEEPTDIHGLVGRWYEAITAGGTRGYVFGHSLRVFNPLTDEQVAQAAPADPYIERLLGNIWRPASFGEMVNTGRYDLRLFSPRYGLFPNKDEKRLDVVMPSYSATFEYTEITEVGARRYLAAGTSLQLTFTAGGSLSIQFIIDDQQYSLALQTFESELDQYIEAELERRDQIYEQFYELGPTLTSSSYGTITFAPNGAFTWESFDALVPAAIPASAQPSGRLMLNHHLSEEIEASYDGVLTFAFNGVSTDDAPHFLYTVGDDGLRLVFAPPATIEDTIIQRRTSAPIVAFFAAE